MPSLCTDSILHTLFLVCANHSWIFAAGHRSGASRAREFHLQPLTEPCVKVSPHTALHTQLFVHRHNLGVWPLCNAHHRNVSDCSSLQRGWCQCLHTDTERPSLISLAVTATSYMEGSKPFIYRCAPRGTRTGSLHPCPYAPLWKIALLWFNNKISPHFLCSSKNNCYLCHTFN